MNETIKIKTKITHTEEKEKEITIPYFFRTEDYVYGIFEPNKCVRVVITSEDIKRANDNWPYYIGVTSSNQFVDKVSCGLQIEAKEFYDALELAVRFMCSTADRLIDISTFPQPEDFNNSDEFDELPYQPMVQNL